MFQTSLQNIQASALFAKETILLVCSCMENNDSTNLEKALKMKKMTRKMVKTFLISFLASGDFCCLLVIFANKLDPEQAPHFGSKNSVPEITSWKRVSRKEQ